MSMDEANLDDGTGNKKNPIYSDISFDPRPKVQRVKIPVINMWINSGKEALNELNESGLYNRNTIIGNPDNLAELTENIETPLTHKGRSKSTVVNTEPSISDLRQENSHTLTYKPNKSNFVYKTNPDKNITALELALYKTFRKAELPVPFACSHEEGLLVDHLGNITLAKEISMLKIISTPQTLNITSKKTLNTFNEIFSLLPIFSEYTNITLNDLSSRVNINYKEYLKNKEIKTIAAKFDGDERLTAKYPHTFNLLKNSSNLTYAEAREYAKLENLFQAAVNKFGIYGVEIHPHNILRPREEEDDAKYNFQIIDFNRTKLFMTQELDSLLYDVATPIRNNSFSILPVIDSNGYPVSDFFTSDEKNAMSLKSVQAYNKELGKNWSEEEYMKYLPLARFYVSKQLMDKTLIELSVAKTFQDVIKFSTEFVHYVQIAKEVIPQIENNFFNGEHKLEKVYNFIVNNQIKPLYEIKDEKLTNKTIYWLDNEEIPSDDLDLI
jgi:hypothetical protein